MIEPRVRHRIIGSRPGRSRGIMLGAAIAAVPLVLVLAIARCEYRLVPPSPVADPVTIHVVDYGQHASLVLPSPAGTPEEWFWGDWNYYAGGKRGLFDGAEALFFSHRSTLGRRSFATGRDLSAGCDVLPIEVERARAARLWRSVDARYSAGSRHCERRHAEGRRFVPDEARYSLTDNSVHQVAAGSANWASRFKGRP